MRHHGLGPSRLPRIAHCPGSVREVEKLKKSGWKEPERDYTQEGNQKHRITEALLRREFGLQQSKQTPGLKDIPEDVEWVVDQIGCLVQTLPERPAVYMETEIPLRGDRYGTPDVFFILPNYNQIILPDFKFGARPVSTVQYNYQIQDYGIGLMDKYGAGSIRGIILQPALDVVDEYVFEKEALEVAWERISLVLRASEDPDAPCIPGKDCDFCPCLIAGTCPTLSKPARYMPEGIDVQSYVKNLNPEQCKNLYLDLAGGAKYLYKMLKTMEQMMMDDEIYIAGHEVGETAKHRVWKDQDQALIEIQQYIEGRLGKYNPRDFTTLLPPARVERKLGGRKTDKDLVAGLTEQPQGDPKIVPIKP